MSARTFLVSSVVLLAVSLLAPRLADAGDPNVVFRGKIMTSPKRYPLSAKSKNAYITAIRKQSSTNFKENKEKKEWKIYFAAFLSKPLNDVEYMVKFYDITSGPPQLLGASEAFNDERGQKTIVSNITLDRKSFGVNKHLLMRIENKGTVLAEGRFKILGEGERYSGKVNFSEEEAQGKDE